MHIKYLIRKDKSRLWLSVRQANLQRHTQLCPSCLSPKLMDHLNYCKALVGVFVLLSSLVLVHSSHERLDGRHGACRETLMY